MKKKKLALFLLVYLLAVADAEAGGIPKRVMSRLIASKETHSAVAVIKKILFPAVGSNLLSCIEESIPTYHEQ